MFLLYVLPVVGVFTDLWFIKTELSGKMKEAVVFKGLASLFFVLLGLVCYLINPTSFGLLIFIGLILGMLGDILLNLRNVVEPDRSKKVFALGILAFIAGHFLYIAALIREKSSIVLPALLIAFILSVVSIPPLMKRITAPSKGLKIFGYVYLAIVITMFACAAVTLIKDGVTAKNMLFAIGAFLFMISDFIMIYYSFGKKLKPLRVTNLLLYYIGQLLIAFCILAEK